VSTIQVNAMTPGLVVTRLTEDALHQYEANDPERAAQFRQSLETRVVRSRDRRRAGSLSLLAGCR
jgi:NAD(P)-dependent dehydrogenase (short-subunit alcohol dehydrogenase family)